MDNILTVTTEQGEEIIRLLTGLQDTGIVIIGCMAVQTGLHLASMLGGKFEKWIQ